MDLNAKPPQDDLLGKIQAFINTHPEKVQVVMADQLIPIVMTYLQVGHWIRAADLLYAEVPHTEYRPVRHTLDAAKVAVGDLIETLVPGLPRMIDQEFLLEITLDEIQDQLAAGITAYQQEEDVVKPAAEEHREDLS